MPEIDKAKVKEIIDIVKRIWEGIKSVVIRIWENLKKFIICFMTNPPVGYKRFVKQYRLKLYENTLIGKSNNWRKIHGLHLIRSNFQ